MIVVISSTFRVIMKILIALLLHLHQLHPCNRIKRVVLRIERLKQLELLLLKEKFLLPRSNVGVRR